jgi:hypothetical protein
MKAFKVAVLALVLASACARPQQFANFDELDIEDDGNYSEENIRALADADLYDLNPVYSYSYQVASDEEQTYIKHQEARDSDVVTGEYSYVDPYGSLITVKYTAGPDGYQETRTSEANFIAIRAQPAKTVVEPVVTPVVKPAPVQVFVRPTPAPARPPPQKEESSEDLIAKIIAQLTPFIKNTVSNSLGARATTTSFVRQPAPALNFLKKF